MNASGVAIQSVSSAKVQLLPPTTTSSSLDQPSTASSSSVDVDDIVRAAQKEGGTDLPFLLREVRARVMGLGTGTTALECPR